jgi:hypothetical protein
MNARLLSVLAAATALAAVAAPAASAAPKKPKQVKASWTVSLPVPFPMSEDVPTGNGCWQGQETATKNSREITLPANGVFQGQVSYTGDWDLYLFDAAGTMLAAAESDETGNTGPGTEKLTFKKGIKGKKVTLVACNWMGLKDATVSYVYTYAK